MTGICGRNNLTKESELLYSDNVYIYISCIYTHIYIYDFIWYVVLVWYHSPCFGDVKRGLFSFSIVIPRIFFRDSKTPGGMQILRHVLFMHIFLWASMKQKPKRCLTLENRVSWLLCIVCLSWHWGERLYSHYWVASCMPAKQLCKMLLW